MADVPILLLTSVSFHGRKDELRAAGATGQLAKPIKQTQLARHVLLALGLHSSAFVERASALPLPVLPARGADTARRRVLLVEDNGINQRIGAALLARGGYECELASNGAEALGALARGPFDAILMDCQMPVMDGYEATRRIRAMETGGARVPIIAMTANAMEGDREKCLEAGMDDYLAKPVTGKSLHSKLELWIGNSHSAGRAARPS